LLIDTIVGATAAVPTGYKVVHVPFKDGKPEGYYENFASGFWVSGERRAEVWGRLRRWRLQPTGLLIADDQERFRGRTTETVKQSCNPQRQTPEEGSRTLDSVRPVHSPKAPRAWPDLSNAN
jgi:hypothetical protein